MNYVQLVLLEDEKYREKERLWQEWKDARAASSECWQRKEALKAEFEKAKKEVWKLNNIRIKKIRDKTTYYDLSQLEAEIAEAKAKRDAIDKEYLDVGAEFSIINNDKEKKRKIFYEAQDEWKRIKEEMDNYKLPPS